MILPMICLFSAPAQGDSKTQGYKPNPQAVKARDTYADIRLLEAIIPLELTKDQLTALLVPMKAAQVAFEGLQKEADDGAKGLTNELAKAKEAALSGTKPSAELSKKIEDIGKGVETRLVIATQKSVEATLSVVLKVFTAPQKQEVLRQSDKAYGVRRVPKAFAAAPEKAPKDQVEALALIDYVKSVILIDRSIALLEAMIEKK